MSRRMGAFRHFVNIERNTPTQDSDTGEQLASWAAIASSVPCEIVAVGGGETVRGRQMDATATTFVRMHHPQDTFTPTPLDRVVFGSRNLNILRAYDPTGLRQELHLQCKEDV